MIKLDPGIIPMNYWIFIGEYLVAGTVRFHICTRQSVYSRRYLNPFILTTAKERNATESFDIHSKLTLWHSALNENRWTHDESLKTSNIFFISFLSFDLYYFFCKFFKLNLCRRPIRYSFFWDNVSSYFIVRMEYISHSSVLDMSN